MLKICMNRNIPSVFFICCWFHLCVWCERLCARTNFHCLLHSLHHFQNGILHVYGCKTSSGKFLRLVFFFSSRFFSSSSYRVQYCACYIHPYAILFPWMIIIFTATGTQLDMMISLNIQTYEYILHFLVKMCNAFRKCHLFKWLDFFLFSFQQHKKHALNFNSAVIQQL